MSEGQGAHAVGHRLGGVSQVEDHLPAKQLRAQPVGRIDHQQAAFEHRDPVAQPVGFIQIVGAQEDCSAFLTQIGDEIAHQVG